MTSLKNYNTMKCPDKCNFYIVASGFVAHKFVSEVFDDNISSPKITIRKGTLVEKLDEKVDNYTLFRIVNDGQEEQSDSVWFCVRCELHHVKCNLVGALEATPPHARLAVVENKHTTLQLLKLNIGEMVNYYPQDVRSEPELTLLKYKGLVPEIGPGIYFGLELLNNVHKNESGVDFKKYYSSPNGCGVFATINQLGLYSRSNVSALVDTFDRATKKSVVSQQAAAAMPSNEKKVHHQHGDGHDQGNFKTTLVLHLKEKDSMPRHSQKTEALVDLDPFTVTGIRASTGVGIANGHSPPQGDNALWTADSVIQQDGHALSHRDSLHNRRQEKKHSTLSPVSVVVKNDNAVSKQKDLKKKQASPKFIESCCNGKSGRQSTKQPGAIQRSESFLCSNPLVELTAAGGPGAEHTEHRGREHVCKSEYVFSEPEPRGDVGGRDGGCCNGGDAVSAGQGVDAAVGWPASGGRGAEGKLRSSYSQDSRLDLLGDSWPSTADGAQARNKTSKFAGAGRRPGRLGSGGEPLEVVGDKLLVGHSQPATEVTDTLLCTSPDLGGCYDVHHTFGDSPEPSTSRGLGVGSVVEVIVNKEPRYGVIRWIGIVPEDKKCRMVAGIEMEEEHFGLTDGTFNSRRYFQCNPKRAMFVSLSQCQKDSRFQDMPPSIQDSSTKTFGQIECPPIKGPVRPICRKGNLEAICGKNKGIQGHHNSCYLDATLFSMFTFTSVFDSLLFRPRSRDDSMHYDEVQRVLREEIVNPLRTNLYVRADRVMKLRTLLENLSSVSGLTSEEKDPEEFLNSLVAQILKAEPFLKLSSGQEAYHYQLFVEKDEHIKFPTVQQLLEQSFLVSGIKLKEVPSCLIIQMPRFGKSFKMYQRILPSQLLDVTDIIEDSPRQCVVCGKLAEFECKECYGQCGVGLESTAFCVQCLETVHSHQRRSSHAWRPLKVPTEFKILQEHCAIPRLYMELFAVVCIETSHYVAFVKCGSGSDAPWCFFDSMADRKGEQNGYNIPEMVSCPNLPYWLSDEGMRSLQDVRDDRQLPEHAKRLLCDAYMCMYQSPDVMMYR